jgi:hypothetical protein
MGGCGSTGRVHALWISKPKIVHRVEIVDRAKRFT